MKLEDYIAEVKDFPIEGILFKDITPLIGNGEAFAEAVNKMTAFTSEVGATVVVGPESRGFIFGCPVATKLNIGFVPIRKPGKLPRESISETYALEYGTNVLSIHKDAIKPGDKVVIIDDLLATGGTLKATVALIERLGGSVVGVTCLIELEELRGRETLKGQNIYTLIKY